MDWEVWRVVRAGLGTLAEIEEDWNLLDLWQANAVVTAFEQAEAAARERVKKSKRGGR